MTATHHSHLPQPARLARLLAPLMPMLTGKGIPLALLCLLTLAAPGAAFGKEADSRFKSWTTAEMLGAMRWAKAEATDKKEKLDFAAAELVCYKRLQKQIDSGSISKTGAFLIAETVRKKGIYKGDKLTLQRADEMRQAIIKGRIFEKLID